MHVFFCSRCESLVFFENFQCLSCGSRLGFAPDISDLTALDPEGDLWRAVGRPKNEALYRRCANDLQHAACNWLIPAADPEELCVSCRHNDVIPDLTVPGNLQLWAKIESAKRRTAYTLLQLSLLGAGSEKLRFNFMGGKDVLTGHADGVITVNIAEADDVERERRRVSLHEPYRTLLGHFRHEIGHFYWDLLVPEGPAREKFRALFDDETRDYGEALKKHYASGPPADWQLNFISAYAAAHPWEDWAETWSHYLHMVDTIETAGSFGMSLKPKDHPDAKVMQADPTKVSIEETRFEKILRTWLPLTYALNSLNRGMGLPDLYPFVLSKTIIEKLRFVHEVIAAVR